MLNALKSWDRAKVAVVGDIMLDIYIQGGVERISPEAPVPVIHQISERTVPGGAANVAANIAALGASVSLVGLAGQDNDFGKLSTELDKVGSVDLTGVLATPARRTTTKTRILGQRQQIARLDREDTTAISAEIEQLLVACTLKAIDDCDLLVLSDYGKGVLSDTVLRAALDRARARGKIAIVDPKRRDLAVYRGASLITPNRAELTIATGERCDTDEEVTNAARKVHAASGADLLVTRSERGMSFVPKQGEPIHLTTAARQVFDVSGAGDTVVATLAVMLATGAPMIDAMKAANHAAGIVVGKLGTAMVSRRELFSALNASETDDVQDGRTISRTELLALRSRWQDEGLVVGFANGCFDVLHPGHVSLIRQAASACDRLVVALNTDQSVQRLKGPTRPVQSEQSRADVMGSIKGVSVVVLFDEETPRELIQAVQPDLLIKGADYTEEEVVGGDIVKARGGRILLAKLTAGQSTSALISKWQDKTSSVGA